MLVDAFGRPTTDLRISVTERCNYRCFFCHNEGQTNPVRPPNDPEARELSPAEIERIVRVGHGLGIRRVKLTGGEPLVRADLEDIVSRLTPLVDVSLTTNGSMLSARAASLKRAGLSRCNVSIDSLSPNQFQAIRGGQLAPVLAGIQSALAAGIRPVKVNAVLYESTLQNIDDLIAFAGNTPGLRLQLIQFMPEMAWKQAKPTDMAVVHALLRAKADAVVERRLHRRLRYRIGEAWVEVVDPVNNPDFCGACHRLRLTADGHLKGCINRNDDLVSMRGLCDEELKAAFGHVVANRRPFYQARGEVQPRELGTTVSVTR